MSTSPITRLRDIVPIRPLTRIEALTIAERQAQILIELAGLTGPPFPEQVIAEVPRVTIERESPWPTSGAVTWAGGRWRIVVNGAEPVVRQRFSLAHEFKHVLDERFIHVLYNSVPEIDRGEWVEQVCDFFAGCLLVPRTWLKRAWAETQHRPTLARRFHVSLAALNTRLAQTGVAQPAPRCTTHGPSQDLHWQRSVDLLHAAGPHAVELPILGVIS
jgi:hypothetical protein